MAVLTLTTAFLGAVGEDAMRDGRAPARVRGPFEVAEAAAGDVTPLGPTGNLWTSPSLPPARYDHAMAYDAQSDRIVLFGGFDRTSGYLGDTWAYDLEANLWTNLDPPSGPTSRLWHAMAYDAQSDRIVLFGGLGGTNAFLGDTWAYDLEANLWTPLSPLSGPTPRIEHAMAYDAQSDRVILFGGYDGNANLGDTWAYDLEANLWTNLGPPSGPTPRSSHAMAYDAQSNRVVLFGGCCFNLGDTWAYDLEANLWTPLSPPSGPTPRHSHAMAYDAESDRVILFGGYFEFDPLNDTWAYNLEANLWTPLSPLNGPTPRAEHAMAYDALSDRIVLFGGGDTINVLTILGDTWAYDLEANRWANVFTLPARRSFHALAYDAQSDRVVLFGGNTEAGYTDDTWLYDTNRNAWTDVTTAIRPPAVVSHAMAYDAESDRVILFGGYGPGAVYSEGTWAYHVESNTWAEMPLANPRPEVRSGHAMAYDAESDRVILYGGFRELSGEGQDTWAYNFNTNTWTNMNLFPSPVARQLHAMAYDAESDRVVLFGGFVSVGVNAETWSYNFNMDTWTNMNPAMRPSQRDLHALAYDTLSDRVVMFGGATMGASGDDETWSYDFNTNTWTNMNPAAKPSAPRSGLALAYDAQSDRTVLFGGDTAAGFTDETWWYNHPSLPAAPQTLQAFAGNAQVTLTWFPPTSDGDSPITVHRLYRGTSSGAESLLTNLGDVLTFTNTGLTNGVTYYFQVSAVNAIGESVRSNEASATPTSGPVPPTAPRSLQAAAGNAAVGLSWLVPSSDGGSPVTTYKVYRDTASGALSLVATLGNVLTHTDPGLTNGVTYYYQVTAVNAVGEGPRSNEASVTPSTTADTTDPTIAIAAPSTGATLTSTSVTVSGTASDDVALQEVEVSVDGTNWVAATGTTSWSGTLTLAEGPNTIYARATDTSGHTATVSVSVTVATPVTGQVIPAFVLIGAVVAAAGGAGIAAFLLWRRRRGKGEAGKPPA